MSTHARVVRRAAQQHHVISNGQLRDLCASRRWVQDNARTGLLTRVVHGVFVVGCDLGELSRDTCASIGVLRSDMPSGLCRETAAEYLGLWNRGPSHVHVASMGRTHAVLHGLSAGIDLFSHRVRSLPASELVYVRGIPVIHALRTIFDLGRVLTPHQLAHVIWNALYAEVVLIEDLTARLAVPGREGGRAVVRHAIELVIGGSCGTKSRSEDECLDIIRRFGFATPLVNVMDASGMPGVRLDFVWPHRRVVLELDGRHHAAMPGIRQSDQSVMRVLRADGWTVRRLHYSRVWNDPMGVVRMLDTVLGP